MLACSVCKVRGDVEASGGAINAMDSPSPAEARQGFPVQGLRLFRFDRETGNVYVLWTSLIVIVAVPVAWGFAVHVADRMIFG